jgi:hypothetical protein
MAFSGSYDFDALASQNIPENNVPHPPLFQASNFQYPAPHIFMAFAHHGLHVFQAYAICGEWQCD